MAMVTLGTAISLQPRTFFPNDNWRRQGYACMAGQRGGTVTGAGRGNTWPPTSLHDHCSQPIFRTGKELEMHSLRNLFAVTTLVVLLALGNYSLAQSLNRQVGTQFTVTADP